MYKTYASGNSGELIYTGTACEFLHKDGSCTVFDDRLKHNPLCVQLTEELVKAVDWLPESCGYLND